MRQSSNLQVTNDGYSLDQTPLLITNKLSNKKSLISKCNFNIHFPDHHVVAWNKSSVLLCAQQSMSQPSSSFLYLLPTQGLLPLQNESQRVRTCSKLSPPSLLSLCFAVVIFKVVCEGRTECQSPLGTHAENGK